MIEELYQKNLMRLAANAHGAGTLEHPDAESTMDNPTCGDRITIQIKLEDGRITELAHENRACMLCQASASLLSENAIGLSLSDVQKIRAEVTALLSGETTKNELTWEKLAYFEPVKDHKSRHICVMLPLNALEKILSDTEKKGP
ncbi:iron-sulfur cluster assembly scaffold protein [Sneathiella aquimaris]|uniref:iron-sulfur cluster assembly scaffold protein n=1 Tax=Sneathiella aquimaris TaxID=2599305 RepID=UPI00146C0968|nr:iron-sulfur cluster assembly scaffold protein [Sneathiella aquimaris]